MRGEGEVGEIENTKRKGEGRSIADKGEKRVLLGISNKRSEGRNNGGERGVTVEREKEEKDQETTLRKRGRGKRDAGST